MSDNGTGLPEKFSPEEQDTLGMNLIQNFAQQLEAELELGTDNGTYIDLKFSVNDI